MGVPETVYAQIFNKENFMAAKRNPPPTGNASAHKAPPKLPTGPSVAHDKAKRQVMVVTFHQARKTIFWIGAYVKDGEHGSITHPKECVINSGKNLISDPDDVAALLADSAFQDSIKATERQKKKGKTLKGIEIELFDAPSEKVKAKADPDADPEDEDDDETPKVNMWEKVPPAKMIDIVKGCVDVKRLQEMQAVETRANVSAALTSRIRFLRKDAAKARDAVGSEERSNPTDDE